ncbi:acylphosphatase [Gimesia aquarii]|uniref:acylphosphatase n=1 Tax=Gimesia aquarii TaxID=2527964 RepID=A0A517WY72_9PLAN|nr:acylphosphatase [Gimesia aquarii]QDU10215.1 Acylphosphatase [Gimesia aquarii]
MSTDSHSPGSSPTLVCLHAVFQGRVQGVGFRYRTSKLAKQHPITGFVKNLSDGTVELVAQANRKAELDHFFDEMMLMFATNVTDVAIQEIDPDSTLQDFRIAR